MSSSLFVRSAQRKPRRAVVLVALALLASLAATSLLAAVALAGAGGEERPVVTAAAAQPAPSLEPFEVTGLPAGAAKGIPQHATLPPGFSLKHVHGGPSYVYVLAGSLDIIDADGSTATYRAGDFFWEPVGHVHTARTVDGAELFILRFLTAGAEGTITVQ